MELLGGIQKCSPLNCYFLESPCKIVVIRHNSMKKILLENKIISMAIAEYDHVNEWGRSENT